MKYARMGVLLALLLVCFAFVPLQGVYATSNASGPVASTWYFAEGRVGSGFRTFFTIGNPTNTDCTVKIAYTSVMDGSSTSLTKTISVQVKANSRYTENANADVAGPATLSATISVDTGATPTCSGVTAERPMYLQNFHSINSGTDIMGATALNTKFYFADVPTHSAGESFLSILNPGDVDAHVTVQYYAGGAQIGSTTTLTVGANSRGTIQPNEDINLPAHVSAMVTSDHSIMVERPSYFVSEYGVSGSADVTGVSALSADWLFAEGNTSSGTQENLTLANFGDTDANAIITLKSLNGIPQQYPVLVKAHDQTIWNVNANNSYSGATAEVAATVHADVSTLAVQREMYTTYAGQNGNASWSSQGVTDTFGATSARSSYSFAEGFTSIHFNEWLLLYNPSDGSETVAVTVNNMLGHTYSETLSIPAQARYTVNVTQLVQDHLVNSGEDARAYAVSMSVSSDSNFVAERTMDWNAFGTQGSNSVVGFTGN